MPLKLFINPIVLLCLFFSWLLADRVMAAEVNLTMARHLHTISGEFRQPSDVEVNDKGDIYIVDGVNHRIRVYMENGRVLFAFGHQGEGPGQFLFPLGIDLDAQGRIYVADSGNGRIQIFSPIGEYISSIKLEGCGDKPVDPTDIAVTSSGNIAFVADNDNHCLLKYDMEKGRLLEVFGKPGIERKEFRYPFLMTLHNDKYLHVVDVVNTRVQVLTDTGKFVTYIGDWGVEKGQLFRPKGVAVDQNGLVYISDSYMGVIQVFTSDGRFHSVIGDPETGEVRRFSTPVGIYVDKKNRLYVVEMFADKVTVFALGQA